MAVIQLILLLLIRIGAAFAQSPPRGYGSGFWGVHQKANGVESYSDIVLDNVAGVDAGAQIQHGLVRELGKAMTEVPMKAYEGAKSAAKQAKRHAAELELAAKDIEHTALQNASWTVQQARAATQTARNWQRKAMMASKEAMRAKGARQYATMQRAFAKARHRAIKQAPANLAKAARFAQAQALNSLTNQMWKTPAAYNPAAYNPFPYNPVAYNPAAYNPPAYPTKSSDEEEADAQWDGEQWDEPAPPKQRPTPINRPAPTPTPVKSVLPEPAKPPPTYNDDFDHGHHYLTEASVHPPRRKAQTDELRMQTSSYTDELEEPMATPMNYGDEQDPYLEAEELREAEFEDTLENADAQLQRMRASRGFSAIQMQPGLTRLSAEVSHKALRGANEGTSTEGNHQ